MAHQMEHTAFNKKRCGACVIPAYEQHLDTHG